MKERKCRGRKTTKKRIGDYKEETKKRAKENMYKNKNK
jgi:hypothetical protein